MDDDEAMDASFVETMMRGIMQTGQGPTMKDIADRLRDPKIGWSGDAACVGADTAEEGATEIDRLRVVLREVISMTKADCSKRSILDYVEGALASNRS